MTDTEHPAPGRSGEDSAAAEAAPRETVPDRHICAETPTELLALIPHMLGFHPADSLVVIGTQPKSTTINVTLRYDLPGPAHPEVATWIARDAARILATERTGQAAAVGYGPDRLVAPVVGELQNLKTPGLLLTEILRAADGRYWSYLCNEPCCCPAGGTPFNLSAEPADAALAAEGPVLSSRDKFAATVARVGGETADVMCHATAWAEQRAFKLLAQSTQTGQGISTRSEIVLTGLDAVAQAIACYRRGGQLFAGDDAAWLTLVLREPQVCDITWSRMIPEHREAHLRLWQDLIRLALPGYVAAPASMLALVAWQSGNGVLANVALDRALADDPTYQIAKLLQKMINSGAPPATAYPPATPEEVAARVLRWSSRTEDHGQLAIEHMPTTCADGGS
jgi:hypothetical protein